MIKKNKDFAHVTSYLSKHYDSLVKKYGNNVKSSQQSNKKTRDNRLNHLVKYMEFKKSTSILDFGCGTGYLFDYLIKRKFKGNYLGIDISSLAIEKAKSLHKKNKNCNFKNINIFKESLNKKFDYIIINGTFNNNTKDNWLWMKKSLKILIERTNKKLIFNNLSIFVDYFDKNLFYLHPAKVLDFVRNELGKKCILDHSYNLKNNVLPYEFTTVVINKND